MKQENRVSEYLLYVSDEYLLMVIGILLTFTDEEFITNPKFGNPH